MNVPGIATARLKPETLAGATAFLACVLAGAWAALGVWQEGQTRLFADSALPMLAPGKSYEYLAQAAAWLNGGTAELPGRLIAWLHMATGMPLEQAAYWLPLCFLPLMALCFAGWTMLLRLPPLVGAAAAVTACLSPVWPFLPGRMDESAGAAVLMHACILATAAMGLPGRSLKAAPIITLAGCGTLLALWWTPGVMAPLLCLIIWGLTYYLAPDHFQHNVRIYTALVLVLGVLAALILPDAWLPSQVTALKLQSVEYLRRFFGLSQELAYFSAGKWNVVGWPGHLELLAGNVWAGYLFYAAFFLMCICRPAATAFLLPALPGLVPGASHFLYLALLPLGLAAALMPFHGASLFSPGKRQAWSFIPGMLALCLLLLALAISPRPEQNLYDDGLDRAALALRSAAPPGAPVWAWRNDAGYLKWRCGLNPFFRSEEQNPLVPWVTALPLLENDARFAARWIRFFGLRTNHALGPLLAAWGGVGDATAKKRAALDTLRHVFRADDPQSALAALPPLPQDKSGAPWLFPEGRMFVFFHTASIREAALWMESARSRDGGPLDAVAPEVLPQRLGDLFFLPLMPGGGAWEVMLPPSPPPATPEQQPQP